VAEPLSPELALVDPDLAERARAQLADGRPEARRSAREPEPPPRRPERRKRVAIVAAIAFAALIGGAGAIWARYDGGGSSSEAKEPPTATRTIAAPKAATAVGGSAPRSPLRPPTRAPAFRVPGAPKEPLDEITLPARARRLAAWLTPGRRPSAANVRHWLYQHAWIVTGAKFGWWHGADAVRILIRVDRRVESRWGLGYRSEVAARRALAEVRAKS
jgi:hypothetical protein